MTAEELEVVRSERTGRVLRARVVPSLRTQAEGLLAEFEARSDEWRSGFTVWFGWGPAVLRDEGNGFVVTVPDYAGDPGQGSTDDLSWAMWILVSLLASSAAAGLEPQEISYTDAVIVVRGWNESPLLALSRVEPRPGDSGWFVEPFPPTEDREWTAERLEKLPAWRVLQERAAVARALSLPMGVAVIVEGDAIRLISREADGAVLASGPL